MLFFDIGIMTIYIEDLYSYRLFIINFTVFLENYSECFDIHYKTIKKLKILLTVNYKRI